MSDAARRKMSSGDWYCCLDDAFEALRVTAREACHQHRILSPSERGAYAPALADLLAGIGRDVWIEAPFHVSYGINLTLGDQVYLNAGCVVLDSAPVQIGTGTMLGPGVQIYCADHHRDPAQRRAGIERALPVTIGADVWIGGTAVILPGVTIGDGAIVAAGAVVTRDVAPGDRVAGVPAQRL